MSTPPSSDAAPAPAPAPPPAAAADRVLVCPGRTGAMDETFYRWLLADTGIQVEPGGSHKDVVRRFADAAGEGEGPSDGGGEDGAAAGPVAGAPAQAVGVVDRGGHPPEVLARHARWVLVLPYFELESYLCHPALLMPALRVRDLELPDDELLDHLIRSARATYMPAVNAHLTHQPRPSGRARLELMAQQYADQLREADERIAARDVEALLAYFPGRRLASRLSRKLDFLSPQHVLETLMRVPGVRAGDNPVGALRRDILARFGP